MVAGGAPLFDPHFTPAGDLCIVKGSDCITLTPFEAQELFVYLSRMAADRVLPGPVLSGPAPPQDDAP